MKRSFKTFALILSILLCLSTVFTSCNKNDEKPQSTSASTTENTSTTKANTSTEDSIPGGEEEEDYSNLTDDEKYEKACLLIEEGKNEEAYALLSEISTNPLAQEKLKNFFYAPQTVDDVKYRYDQSGNITELIDYDGQSYTFFYNEDGNVIGGRDLIFGAYYNSYTYRDGKLYQLRQSEGSESHTTTYYYNQDGLVSKSVFDTGRYQSETVYSYTFYDNGNIKTMLEVDEDDWGYEYSYNENGQLVKLAEYYQGDVDDGVFLLTYGEYGLTRIDLQTTYGYMANFVYTYNAKGILSHLHVNYYEDGILENTFDFTFENHKLCYSENPTVKDRLAVVCYTDMDAVMEIIG